MGTHAPGTVNASYDPCTVCGAPFLDEHSTRDLPAMVADLELRGFDRCAVSLEEPASVSLGCSQCEALAINGHASHETGCPNVPRRRDCGVCGYSIPDECTGCPS